MSCQLLTLILLLGIVACHTFDPRNCLAEYRLSHADLEAISPHTPVSRIPENVKCYAKCLLKDYLGDDNRLSMGLVGDKANAQEKLILQSCSKEHEGISGTAPCDYVYLLVQCLTLRTEANKELKA